ncbi:tetratricopeptide repeat protein [Helicobacter himalayensis]|uniref:tetratricopeptide repeat protein n=1 Tax=Helicobacter himalayensis TaxID=1591088 RepID=UPI003D6EF7B7
MADDLQEVDLNDPKRDSQTESNATQENAQENAQESEQGNTQKEGGFKAKLESLFACIKSLPASLKNPKQNKKIFFIVIGIVVCVVMIIVLGLVFALKAPVPQEEEVKILPPKKIQTPPIVQTLSRAGNIDDDTLDEMIKKANLLYEQGDKMQALDLFEYISIFSQSLASYNLGVIKLKEGQYKQAIASFDNAINAGEDISVSALNAAYAAYKLGDITLSQYYLGLSASHLYDASKQPLYSYVYALINTYKGFYFESLSPLLHPNSKLYQTQNNKIAARTFLLFNDDFNALNTLKKTPSKKDNLAIALLHARLGEYDKARSYIYEYLSYFPKDPDALAALQLIEIKLGNFKESATILNRFVREDEHNPKLETYPIRIKLKEDLFDVNIAQENFWNRKFEHQQILSFKILYFYAPLRVFDAKEALEAIRDGGINAKIQNIEIAKSGLSEGSGIAKVNQNIVLGLKEAYKNNLRKAREYMQKAVAMYPNHSILHYNLGVLSAQFGDYDNAYTHFLRAYHLDTSDILSGLFAVIAGKLTYRNTDRILSSIRADFIDIGFEDKTKEMFLLSLLRYLNNVPIDDFSWIEQSKQKLPIYYALQSVCAMAQNNPTFAMQSFKNLQELYPRDVVSNIMYELARFHKKDLQSIALELNANLSEKNLDKASIYFGPTLARELFVYVGFITGTLSSLESELERKLLSENENSAGILQLLGLLNIYNSNFEKAFVYYNTLIDDLKEDDAHTRFLGAVAALGADRHENAVALLQISKLESVTNLEAKFALALLYQENKNFKAAADHYEKISNSDFMSEYFDFDINTQELVK